MARKHRERFAVIILIVLLAFFCVQADLLLIPKQYDYGSMWGRYVKEEKNTFDVMFFGSSLVYCNIIPAIIWQESGASPYVLGGSEQTVPILYYYLKEAYRTQTPKYLFIEATNTFYHDYEGFSVLNVGNMPWTINRLQATWQAVEKEEWLGLFFPLYNYHGRWNHLSRRDLQIYFFGYKADPLAGYTFLGETEIQDAIVEIQELPGSYARNLEYQQKVVDLAASYGSQVVYYISPCVKRPSQPLSQRLEKDLLAMGDVAFVDFNRDFDSFGFDLHSDFYDNLHLNNRGAEKFSSFLGQYLLQECGYQPVNNLQDGAWQQRLQAYWAFVEEEMRFR